MIIPKFVLASASPARRQLLRDAGIEPVAIKSDFDESQIQLSNPVELVQVLAHHKAKTVVGSLSPYSLWEDYANGAAESKGQAPTRTLCEQEKPALVLGCDSVLVLAGEIFGKPTNAAEAIARWQQMRASSGELYTGHALIDLYQNTTLVRYQVTRVYFADISDRQIQAYVATGEPLQCAGGFALEGKGGVFVDKLEGCHTNVIGLSLPLLRQMLSALGYDISDFWHS